MDQGWLAFEQSMEQLRRGMERFQNTMPQGDPQYGQGTAGLQQALGQFRHGTDQYRQAMRHIRQSMQRVPSTNTGVECSPRSHCYTHWHDIPRHQQQPARQHNSRQGTYQPRRHRQTPQQPQVRPRHPNASQMNQHRHRSRYPHRPALRQRRILVQGTLGANVDTRHVGSYSHSTRSLREAVHGRARNASERARSSYIPREIHRR